MPKGIYLHKKGQGGRKGKSGTNGKDRHWKLSDNTKENIRKARIGTTQLQKTKDKIRKTLQRPRLEIRGDKHWNWKNGITSINQSIRNSFEYNLWEQSIFVRDYCKCQNCSENRIRNLVAHHILNFSQYPELRFAIDNGITFCNKCHKLFHKKYSVKNNTRKQVEDWLELNKN